MSLTLDESVKKFEDDKEDIVQEIILLGKNGNIRRLRMEEKDNDKIYFG
ncbi:hypothetical protein M0R04_11140 [Candidatus Dojkabacteria bacterium]|jgi:hypothetical protein|nr:hypothetical protein [Candidatus Dojkabacteria bacterium]